MGMIKRAVVALLAGGVVFGAVPALAQGPSFNCRYASTYVELAICDSRELSRLDRVLALEYRKAINRLDRFDAADLADDQESWIGRRDSCDSNRCIDRAYRTRIALLRGVGRF
jgi:uncharacterized protein